VNIYTNDHSNIRVGTVLNEHGLFIYNETSSVE